MRDSQIPLKFRPSEDEVRSAIASAFQSFNEPLPSFTLKRYGQGGLEPFVAGEAPDDWCWLRVFEWPGDVSDNHGLVHACTIESRGADKFCALVMYGMLRAFGSIAFDDAGYLMAGEEMTEEEMFDLIVRKFFSSLS